MQSHRPDLAHVAAQLAANHAKVAGAINSLASRVDGLVAATAEEDWDKVCRLSQDIAEEGRAHGYRAVSAMAQRVHDEARRGDNVVGVKRSLIRLIGTCDRAGRASGIAQQG